MKMSEIAISNNNNWNKASQILKELDRLYKNVSFVNLIKIERLEKEYKEVTQKA